MSFLIKFRLHLIITLSSNFIWIGRSCNDSVEEKRGHGSREDGKQEKNNTAAFKSGVECANGRHLLFM